MFSSRLSKTLYAVNPIAAVIIVATYIASMFLFFNVFKTGLEGFIFVILATMYATFGGLFLSSGRFYVVKLMIWAIIPLVLIRTLFYPVEFEPYPISIKFESIIQTFEGSPRIHDITTWMDKANISYTIDDFPFDLNSSLEDKGVPDRCMYLTSNTDVAYMNVLRRLFIKHSNDTINTWLVIFEDDAETNIAHEYVNYMTGMFHAWQNYDVIWLDVRSTTNFPHLGGGMAATAFRVKSMPIIAEIYSIDYYCHGDLDGFNIQADTVLMRACRTGLVNCKHSPVFHKSGKPSTQIGQRQDTYLNRVVRWFNP